MVHATTGNRPDPRAVVVEPFPKLATSRSRLPVPLSDFIERPREVEALRALLSEAGVRLVTLTGPGGAGKTRLALRLAAELEPAFAAGTHFVPLASVSDPDLIPATIALALGLHLSGDQRLGTRLAAVLRHDGMLLMLDNFEHVLPAATIVSELLHACPGLKVLVTSRAPLRLTGERVFPISGMHQPDPLASASGEVLETEAVQLFVTRANEATAQFALTDENAADVAAICRRVDGLPLAIELAAARVAALPPRTLLARLNRSLSLLTDGPRDAPDRLQTMRGAIAWSHQLLTPPEQALFRRLGVFDGGCTLEAAEAVAGAGLEVIDGLAALVASSLLQCHDEPGDEPRYAMLETIRTFALEQLATSGEEASIRDAHAAWCLALAESAWPGWMRTDEVRWIRRFNVEHDNVRAALAWLTRNGGTEHGLRLISVLWPFWTRAGWWGEGRAWFERALVWSAGARTRLRVDILVGAASTFDTFSNYRNGALRTIALSEEGLAIAREIGYRDGEVRALICLADSTGCLGDFDRSKSVAEASLAVVQAAGDALSDAMSNEAELLCWLGLIALNQNDDATAERLVEEALAIKRRNGSSHTSVANACIVLSVLAYRRDDMAVATAFSLEALRLMAPLRNPWTILLAIDRLAIIAGEDPRQATIAAQLGGAVERLHEVLATRPNKDEQPDRDRARAAASARLGDDAFAKAWAVGRSLRLEEAAALGLSVKPPVVSGMEAQSGGDTAGKAGITLRELDVLRLIASGRTDQEIADALFVSRRTVNAHVAHILAKLDVGTRREAATRGRDLGLLMSNSSIGRYT